jgi:UDP-N-acetylmuramate--alanine ligase
VNLKTLTYIYFLGIGGIGMSALARYFNAMGKKVSGYDKTPTALTNELIAEGIDIHFDDHIRNIPVAIKELPYDLENILIVHTPAVPVDHSEYVFFKMNGFTIKKRAEVLGMITSATTDIAVAGTHGKTTTSSLIAHILKTAGLDPSAFLGGITRNYNTNLLLSSHLRDNFTVSVVEQPTTNNQQLTVVEADEYDRSFLTLHPEMAVITSVDADHLDIYGDKSQVEESFSLFARQVKSKLVLKKSIVSKVQASIKPITYSISDDAADYFAQHIKIENGSYHYDIVTPTTIFENLTMGLPGLHNVENSVAAVAIACQLNISESNIRKALQSFKGVQRRFDYHIKTDNLVFIDDYAHHPEELRAVISSVREMYPGKKICGIFQPHLYSRTRDFADEFARSLDLLDECILMEIYPARELPIPGVSSQMLLDKMKISNKTICQKENLLTEVVNRKFEVLLTMGAGDINTFVDAITNVLSKE